MSEAQGFYEDTGDSSGSMHTPAESSTVVELLRSRALHQPNQLAYSFLVDGDGDERCLTYGELDRKARAVAVLLQSMTVAGERALLLYPSGLDYLAAFFGCLYAQLIAVPAYPPRPAKSDRKMPRLWAIINDCQPSVALGTTPILASMRSLIEQNRSLQAVRWIATEELADDLSEDWRQPEMSGNALALLQYTSGSTAMPKGVMVSHRNLLHNQEAIKLSFRQTQDSVIVGWLPMYHDMGLIGNILQPLYIGAPCVLMSPTAFLLNPLRWLKAISHHRGTTSGGPNFAYDLCVRKISPEQRNCLDLSTWTTAFNGAEPVRQETMERFAAAFGPCGFQREAFSPCYGLAEATLIVTGGLRATSNFTHTVKASGLESNIAVAATAECDITRTLVSCGHALLDHKVLIVDPETCTLSPSDSVGEVWVAGASVTQGYWNRPVESEQVFNARLADTGEAPFLRTGDLGFLNNGHLYLTGRLKDLIVIRGRNHYPQDIELSVEQSHAALRAGGGAAFSVEVDKLERLVVVQEIEFHQHPDLGEVFGRIRQAISEEHEIQVHAVVLVRPGSIPKTSSGKIQRHLCRSRFQDGKLDVVDEWHEALAAECEDPPLDSATSIENTTDIEQWLASQLAIRVGLSASDIDVTRPIAHYGVDSLLAIELTHSIEARLGVMLPVVSLLQSPSISELAAKVFAQLITSAAATEASISPVVQSTFEHPLSYGQRALYFLNQLAPESAAYHITRAVRIRSNLNPPALRRSFQTLVHRHPSLRTTFKQSAEAGLVQVVHDQAVVCFQHENAESWSEEILHQRLAEEARRQFDLERGPLLRVNLFKRPGQEYVLVIALHHIVADFWSLAVLVNELGIIYLAENSDTRANLPPLSVQYGDYVRWQERMLASEGGARLWSHWEKQLAGDLPSLNLSTDHPRPPIQDYHGASEPFVLSAELTERLRLLGKEQGATLYMILLAGFYVLLHRWTGQEDILVGSPTAGRSLAELAGLVGYFVNPVVLRADLSGNPTFGEFLKLTRETVLAAFEHQDYPLALLVERLQPERDPSRSPLFQAMFSYQKTQQLQDEGLALFALGETGAQIDLGGLSLQSIALRGRVAQFDLTLMVSETAGKLGATIEYNTDLFEATTIKRLILHFQNLLEVISTDPTQRISTLSFLSEVERQQLRSLYDQSCSPNLSASQVRGGNCVHELFEALAARNPGARAVVDKRRSLSYSELNWRANQVGRRLRRLGVRAETRVGILLERSVEMVVALLGVLKAGGAYVPLDAQYPPERLRYMLEQAAVSVVVTEERLLEMVPACVEQRIVLGGADDWEEESGENLERAVQPENLAYVIYTSGSTGTPKGVMITHGNLANFCSAMDERIGEQLKGVWLALTSMSFDISVLELLWTVAKGFTVVIQDTLEGALDAPMRLHRRSPQAMEFSLFYFASDGAHSSEEKYQLLFEGAKFADQHEFSAVWTPERHFHDFGGLYPSPSVTSAALAAVTERIKIRAGSVVLPLHSPIRVAEEWSVIDNFSKGRVGISFASGWHADDFVFAPNNYAARKELMVREIETVRQLWRGEGVSFPGGAGNEVKVRILPRPLQPELPVWITAAGDRETFRTAGEIGASLLTHLLGQSVEELFEKIKVYRQAWLDHGHGPGKGHVTLMLHTFVGEDLDEVRRIVREPFSAYLKTSFGLIKSLARSLGKDMDSAGFTEEDLDVVVRHAFNRYFETSGLMGTPETCGRMVERLREIGVDEIACLIDFGIDYASVMRSLKSLEELKTRSNFTPANKSEDYSLAAQLTKHQVTHLQCTPSTMSVLTQNEESLAALGGLRKLMIGGEILPPSLLRRLGETVTGEIHNMYGPTETTIWSATHLLDQHNTTNTVSIGRPILNTQIYILNNYLELVPVGVVGEMYIGGAGIARGYINQPGLTSERFIADPFSDQRGARMYKTGDRARYLPSGLIEFMGRLDHQVKIRGFRIELGEIAAVLTSHRAVREGAIVVDEDAADKRLIAYVVVDPAEPLAIGALRSHLKEKLPAYMVPSAFVLLSELPRMPNGKLNRRALPAPSPSASEEADNFIGPRTPIEEVVAAIWTKVLGAERVSVVDNFFEIGGHSVLAIQVASRLRDTFDIELPVRVLFEKPTVESLAYFIEQSTERDFPVPPITHVSRDEELPLSFAQQRLWFLDQLEPGNAVYCVPVTIRVSGSVNVPALEASINEVIRRHEILRSRFVNLDGRPVQVIDPPFELSLAIHDLTTLCEEDREAEVHRLEENDARQPFDLQRGPLLRVSLVRLAAQDHVVLLTMHHIISDGWSMGVLWQELSALYSAASRSKKATLSELPVQYVDYAVWQREWLKGEVLGAKLAFWKENLANATPVLELPTDHVRESFKAFCGATETFELPRESVESLKALARNKGVTLFMTLLAGFAVLLYRHTGQEDILIGTPLAARNLMAIERLIGLFINTVVLRIDLSGNPGFRELLSRVREVCIAAYTHQDLPFEKLVEELQPDRDLSRSPLFQVMFILQNAPPQSSELLGLNVTEMKVATRGTQFDLTLSMEETANGLTGHLDYNRNLFEEETIRELVAHYRSVLEGVSREPERSVSRVALMSEEERRKVIGAVEELAKGGDREECLHELFEAQVRRTPEGVALIDHGRIVSYGELNRRANELGNQLRRLGVGAESRVGILLGRSVELVVGLLAVMKAGGAYVPLDGAYPSERLRYMLADAGVTVLLSEAEMLGKHGEVMRETQAEVFYPRSGWERQGGDEENVESEVEGKNLAYLIYTSGSTGRPKAVAVEHRNVVALMEWGVENFSREELAGVLFSTSICFDLSVFELFMPLSNGGAVVIARDVLELAEIGERSGVTLVNTVPTAMSELLRMGGVPGSVRSVNLAGEVLSEQLVEQVYAIESVKRVRNLYGPSEDTTYTSCAELGRGVKGAPRIGRAIKGTGVYVLNAALEPVPVGVYGELYVGGAGVARGYQGRADLTAEKFIPDPFGMRPGGRLYRTGDLGRYRRGGELEYQGRKDQQVKVRGYRIELGEIEAALERQAGVREAVVIVSEGAEGDKQIVGCIVGEEEREPTSRDLRNQLRAELPEYLVPGHFKMLREMPRTANGKVDRLALAAMSGLEPAMARVFVEPRSLVEEMLSDIFSQVLGQERVSIEENFFDLGGHSLLATRVIARVRDWLQVELPLRCLFENPTIAALAVVIEQLQNEQNGKKSFEIPVMLRGNQRLSDLLSKIDHLSEAEARTLVDQRKLVAKRASDNG